MNLRKKNQIKIYKTLEENVLKIHNILQEENMSSLEKCISLLDLEISTWEVSDLLKLCKEFAKHKINPEFLHVQISFRAREDDEMGLEERKEELDQTLSYLKNANVP